MAFELARDPLKVGRCMPLMSESPSNESSSFAKDAPTGKGLSFLPSYSRASAYNIYIRRTSATKHFPYKQNFSQLLVEDQANRVGPKN
mmetsp:Transcript_5504/g.8193  ORF Transcript_5504/g.8193 Transcript_5504/m.8193 type:complete len:88 (-) Transcript_5504:74-337(-)